MERQASVPSSCAGCPHPSLTRTHRLGTEAGLAVAPAADWRAPGLPVARVALVVMDCVAPTASHLAGPLCTQLWETLAVPAPQHCPSISQHGLGDVPPSLEREFGGECVCVRVRVCAQLGPRQEGLMKVTEVVGGRQAGDSHPLKGPRCLQQ